MQSPLSLIIGAFGFLTVTQQVVTDEARRVPSIVPIETPAQPNARPLYPQSAPPIQGAAAVERWGKMRDEIIVRNVTQPTITPYLPDPIKATGAAVIVAPGGAFMQLSMKYEGSKVAEYLASQGITAFVLKYRLQPTAADEQEYSRAMGERMRVAAAPGTDNVAPLAFQPAVIDGIAAIRFVRDHAAQFQVDAKRVGLLGFSAGAKMALDVTLVEDAAARPDFVGMIYGPMNAVEVPVDAPPMFAAIAADDPLFGKGNFDLITSWRSSRRPVELHVYQVGGHGFGIHNRGTTSDSWPSQFIAWLRTNKLM